MLLSFILTITLLLSVLITFSSLTYRWIKRKQYPKGLRLFSLFPWLILSFILYRAIYPSDEFYKDEYKKYIKDDFPTSGIIHHKTTSYPDQHGDYTSCFVAELIPNDLFNLERQLISNKFEPIEYSLRTKEQDYIQRKIKNKKPLKSYRIISTDNAEIIIDFLDDKKSIIVTRIST